MLLQRRLRTWREEQARREGIESYKILSKATLDALLSARPQSKEELLLIKGIKEKKFQKYGKSLLEILQDSSQERVDTEEETFVEEVHVPEVGPLSVGQFLDTLNMELSGMAARVQGEVTSVDVRERVVYFSIKDKTDGSTLPCLIFRFAYQISGVALKVGDEIIVEGVPEIYKPNGRLSLKVGLIELAGEGMLKKAYDELYLKLEKEGLMAEEKKRDLPRYPERVALITSSQGAAIDDFKMNLGNFGFKIDFYPTAVEGKKAVFEILKALAYFRTREEKYDLLVLIRGGGSLESLQAFNNEALAREIATYPMPTLLGVGHEKDITLAALVSDKMVSTPTASAKELAYHWAEARQLIRNLSVVLPRAFEQNLAEKVYFLNTAKDSMLDVLRFIQRKNQKIEQEFFLQMSYLRERIRQKQTFIYESSEQIRDDFMQMIRRVEGKLTHSQEQLKVYDPMRALRLGYSLIKKDERVIKDSKAIQEGDILNVQLARGSFDAMVKKVNRQM